MEFGMGSGEVLSLANLPTITRRPDNVWPARLSVFSPT